MGHGEVYKYGEKIKDNTTKCGAWGANLDYFTYETNKAPRFLCEKFNDSSISYEDFSKQLEINEIKNEIDKLKLKFKNQDFQTYAVNAVVDLFLGQEKTHSTFSVVEEKQMLAVYR